MRSSQLSIFDIPVDDCRLRSESLNGIRAGVSWSGGKDSTATAILAIIDGYEVKMATSLVQFYPGIPLITKRMVDFIYRTAERFREYGATVDIIKPVSYYELCTRVIEKSPYPERNGKLAGYPCFCHCNFQQYFKSFPLQKWEKNNECDVSFIGICYDEIDRQGQLNDYLRSLLVEKKLTQTAARMICEQNDMLSPVYETGTRDGCALCFNNKPEGIREWLNDYPEALPILRELDATLADGAVFSNRWGRNGITLHDIGII